MNCIDYYDSPLGGITIAGNGEKITGLWFDGQKYDRLIIKNSEVTEKSLPVFEMAKHWLDLYFAGEKPDFTPPLAISGSEFRRSVARIMLNIPYGTTMTYGEIAARIARQMGKEKMSAQAIGGAVGHNAISLIIPCHRVVGTNGSLTGYAGGIEKKHWLLEHEGVCLRDGKVIRIRGEAE